MNIGDRTLIHLIGYGMTCAKVVAYKCNSNADWITFEFIEGPIDGQRITLRPEQLRENQAIGQ
jgi:hypothetical protein